MKVTRNDWWVTPVWQIETDFNKNFNEKLLSELKNYYTKKTNTPTEEDNIWEMTTPCVKEINKYILEMVSDLTHDYVSPNYDKFEYQHTKGWVNYHLPGQSMPVHGHGGSKITATYYVQAENNCGDLLLVDPRGGVDWDKENDGVNGAKFKRISPKESMLVFFPSYVMHYVDINKSKNIRISLTTDMQTYSLNLFGDFFKNFISFKEKQNVV